jgi:hypothetical protein
MKKEGRRGADCSQTRRQLEEQVLRCLLASITAL